MYAKQPFGVKVAQFQLDLSRAAGTHGIAEAAGLGDIEIVGASIYCTVVGQHSRALLSTTTQQTPTR